MQLKGLLPRRARCGNGQRERQLAGYHIMHASDATLARNNTCHACNKQKRTADPCHAQSGTASGALKGGEHWLKRSKPVKG